jgi:hypothetical protein
MQHGARFETQPWGLGRRGPPASFCAAGTGVCEFDDVRLGRRFRSLLEQICEAVGESIPLACQDWANTKAAYRFLSNGRVNEEDILSGHFHPSSTVAARSQPPRFYAGF